MLSGGRFVDTLFHTDVYNLIRFKRSLGSGLRRLQGKAKGGGDYDQANSLKCAARPEGREAHWASETHPTPELRSRNSGLETNT